MSSSVFSQRAKFRLIGSPRTIPAGVTRKMVYQLPSCARYRSGVIWMISRAGPRGPGAGRGAGCCSAASGAAMTARSTSKPARPSGMVAEYRLKADLEVRSKADVKVGLCSDCRWMHLGFGALQIGECRIDLFSRRRLDHHLRLLADEGGLPHRHDRAGGGFGRWARAFEMHDPVAIDRPLP